MVVRTPFCVVESYEAYLVVQTWLWGSEHGREYLVGDDRPRLLRTMSPPEVLLGKATTGGKEGLTTKTVGVSVRSCFSWIIQHLGTSPASWLRSGDTNGFSHDNGITMIRKARGHAT